MDCGCEEVGLESSDSDQSQAMKEVINTAKSQEETADRAAFEVVR